MKKIIVLLCAVLVIGGVVFAVFSGAADPVLDKLGGAVSDFKDGLQDSFMDSEESTSGSSDESSNESNMEIVDESASDQESTNTQPVIGESTREKTPLELEDEKRDTYEERLEKDEVSKLIYDNFNKIEFRVPKVYGNSFVISSKRYVIGDRSRSITPADPEMDDVNNLEFVSTVFVVTEDNKTLSLFDIIGLPVEYCELNGIPTDDAYINPLNNRAIFLEKNIDESIDNIGVYRTLNSGLKDIQDTMLHLN